MENKEQFKLNKKRKPTEANTKMTQMFELSDKKFKAAVHINISASNYKDV